MEYFTLDERGRVQAINVHTGEIRAVNDVLPTVQDILDTSKMERVYTSEGELAYVPKGISLVELEKIQGPRAKFPYSPLLADQICERIAQGATLVEVSRTPGMPTYSTLARWRRDHPEFDELYKLARKDRSEVYFHKILEEVENAQANRDEIALARLKTDIYKFAAKVCAPDDYVEKTTIDARVAVGSFSIETGIRRDGDPGFNKDETKEIPLEEGKNG